ncbi:MAG: ABC transporter ATP-binding protein [Dietzia sp.]|nr:MULTISPECIES: ABC transporter ATP-binding protein [Dietzia]MBB1038100.1 ABC transporter ATP-binding protein [Dietzia natronolimnaea]MBB1041499.1 ABC transporter ATP-binding protein [Dietzia sp. Cai40]MBB1044866.1 ABC transporter ATP-binding protein [Dietzia sp. DQ11-44]MBB1047857.1 ABC transporter ATP-binding protein [Dietzia cercidiphylli]MBB1050910.1 ABC transporter ATP-binding protein [Dietzia sp. CW19]
MQQAAMRTLMRAENNNITLDRSVFTRENFHRIGQFARPHTRLIVLFLILSVFGASLAVVTPLLAGRVVTAIVDGAAVRVVFLLAAAIAVIGIVEAVNNVVTRFWSARIGEGLILDLRRSVFDHVQTMPVAFFMRTRTGALVSRLNNDVLGAQRAFSDTLSGVVSNLVQLILTLVVMAGINWQLTLMSVLLLPVFLFPARYVGRRLARLRREASDLNASMNDQMTERFNAGGATLVKLFGRPDAESAEFASRAGRVRGIGVRTALLMSVFMNSLTLVSTLALALVYGVGGWFALTGGMDAGSVVALALLLTRLYGPLTSLANAPMDVVTAIVSFERVFEVLDLDPLLKDAPDAVDVPEGPAAIEFDDVRFSYPSADKVSLASLEEVAVLDTRGGQEVLHGVSFHAEPGQMIALVGSSGAGKSTIASLLPRLYDVDSGAVRVAGLDVREVTSSSLRRTVGMVTQDGHLFHDTIRSNLTFARPEVTDELVWDALRRARLEELVRSLPDGLDTVIGDRGYRLSGGERQRLTIARLLIAEPSVVVLDEATSALDSTNESAVQEALTEAMSHRTSLVIAHRLSTVRAADRILVLEGGSVVESGTHPELLAAGGRYTELYETQFADQE